MTAERRVVASLLNGGAASFRLYSGLAGDVRDPVLAELMSRMKALTSSGRDWDVGTLFEEFKDHPVITAEYLAYLIELGGSPESVRFQRQDVLDERLREKLGYMLGQVRTRPAAEVAAELQSAIWEYQRAGVSGWDRRDALKRMLDEIERDLASGMKIRTGIGGIDDFCGGFRGGEVTFLGARPTAGKSALAVNIADYLIIKGHKVLFFDLETGDTTLLERFVSLHTGIPIWQIAQRRLSEDELVRVVRAAGEIEELPLTINDHLGLSIGDIQAQAISSGAELIIIDYLTLLVRDTADETTQLGDIMAGLVGISKGLNVPILVLGQLNRYLEHRTDQRPRLSDIRGSGKIEEYAFKIWFLDYPFKYDQDASPDHKELIIAKCKHGPTGKVDLHWEGSTMRLSDPPERSVAV